MTSSAHLKAFLAVSRITVLDSNLIRKYFTEDASNNLKDSVDARNIMP